MKQRHASQREATSSWNSIWVAIGNLLRLLLQAKVLILEKISLSFGVAQYEVWRQRFLYRRLRLGLQIALLVTLIAIALEFFTAGFALTQRFVLYGVVALCLTIGLALRQTAFGRTHSKLLFLGIYWAVTLIPGLEYLLEPSAVPNLNLWTLTFLVNALLVPVYWWLHLLSQVGVVTFHIAASMLDAVPRETFLASFQQILYLFWVCFICDLSIYLHERFHRNEMESRSELQIEQPNLHDTSLLSVESAIELQQTDNPAHQTGWLINLDRSIRRINALLATSIAQAEAKRLYNQPLSLSSVVQAAIAQLEPLLIQHQPLLTNSISSNLPLVKAHPHQLRLVFENLIKDALERNAEGIHLTLSAEVIEFNDQSTLDRKPPQPTMIRCTIQDNGIPIELRENDSIVDLAEQDSDDLSGWLMNLSMSQQIIWATGGDFGISNHHGTGTRVWFTLPLAASQRSTSDLTIAN